ncbi:MAG TPA: hypothetical protein VF815_10445 [Myxococcaceae bacterium]|jgi:hypothetical protein
MKAAPGLIPAVALSVLGLAQMTGDLLGILPLKGVAAATCASPAPKVFSAVRGFETYSTRFYLEWTDKGGAPRSVPITSELTSNFEGPYNRRNVYGAALAYGPVMPQELRGPVMAYALCGQGRLLSEMGVSAPERGTPFRVRFEPRPGTQLPADLPLTIEAPCF